MANTYKLIEGKKLTDNQSSVTFTSIPDTYTDLLLYTSLRYGSGGDSRIFFNFNNTGYVASSETMTGYSVNGSNNTAGETFTGNGVVNLAAYTGTSESTLQFATSHFYIANYKNTTRHKTITAESVQHSNNSTVFYTHGCAKWSSTSAITSIEIKPGSNNFIINSTFYLYGISNL